MIPLGTPDVPEVKITYATSEPSGRSPEKLFVYSLLCLG